jgi:outer membrane protein assembly factor BamB
MKTFLSLLGGILFSIVGLHAADWPHWQGPNRNRTSPETGLLTAWPAGGPRLVWTASGLGGGYGSMAVVGDRVYLQGARASNSVVMALNRADGKEVWSKSLGPIETRMRTNQGAGPRGTPTVDGNRLYVLSENGDLVCLQTDGTAVWQRNILKDFGGPQISWMISESPLVDGPHVVVSPGGPGAGLVKLDKMTGHTVWTSKELSDEAAYSSITAADIQGVRTYMTFTGSAGVGVRASDGKLMFRYPTAANRVANVATPVYSNNKVFFASGYGTGGGLLDLRVQNGEVSATEVYFTRDMQNHHGGVLLIDGVLYGFSNAILTALDFSSGKTLWRHRSVGKGAITYADGRLYVLSEDNVVGLAEVSASGYREVGRFQIADQGLPSWAHPVVSGKRLFIRNQNVLAAYDVRAR